MSQQLNNDQFYQRFGNGTVWASGWGMWDIKDNNTRPTDLLPEILQMAKLELINSKIMTQDTMTGSFIGLNPLRDPCHGDSGEIFT